jgi:hypothetical protein
MKKHHDRYQPIRDCLGAYRRWSHKILFWKKTERVGELSAYLVINALGLKGWLCPNDEFELRHCAKIDGGLLRGRRFITILRA